MVKMVCQTLSESTHSAGDGTTSSQEPLHSESPQRKKCDVKGFFKRNLFVLVTIVAIATGVGVGIALRHTSMSLADKKYFTFPGELLLRMFQCLLLPLISSSVITGLASVKSRTPGRLGICSLCYFTISSVIALLTGIVVVVLIQPGRTHGKPAAPPSGNRKPTSTVDAILDLFRNIFPSNMVEVCFEQYKTTYSGNATDGGIDLIQATESSNQVPIPGSISAVNILGLVTLSVAFGLVLGRMGDDGKPMGDFFRCLNQATMHLISVVIWFTPVGIFFLVGGQILLITDFGAVSLQIAMYTITVLLALVIHSLVILPIIYIAVTGKNPLKFLGGLANALTTALATSSSLVTMPVTLRCLEENLNLDQRVTRVILPIASSVTMEGTALYEAVAAIFIAQMCNVHLNAAEIIIVSITATFAAIGGAGIPSGGAVTSTLVLSSVGLPLEGVAYIIAVDWILDRVRTVTNVLSDSVGVAVVHHLCRDHLQSCGPIEQHLVDEDKQSPSNKVTTCMSYDD